MGRFAVVAALLIAGCYSDPSGTLLVFEGAKKFDQVELYFGKDIAGPTPTTPARADNPPERQQLVKRLFAETPEDDTPPPQREADTSYGYFIEPAGDNLQLGDYVMVIALANGTPIGVGELFDFELPGDGSTVNRYIVPLVDYANEDVERWGMPADSPVPTNDCVRWTHPRGAGAPDTVAVVRPGDSDCDSFPNDQKAARMDCKPLAYCDGTPLDPDCTRDALCLQEDSNGVCASGVCLNSASALQSCARTTCAEPSLCGACPSGTPSDLADCMFSTGANTHTDVIIPLAGPNLCTSPGAYSFAVRLSIPCTAPRILAHRSDLVPDPFSYGIDGDLTTGDTCQISITPPSGMTPPYSGTPHLVVEVASAAGSPLPATQFILGIRGDSNMPCSLSPAPQDLQDSLDSCAPQ